MLDARTAIAYLFLRATVCAFPTDKRKGGRQGLKHSDITAILGPVDETLMAELLATGATASELAEAIDGSTTTRR